MQTRPSLIDTHCHFDDDRFDHDRKNVYQRAVKNGVCGIIVPAVTRARWRMVEKAAQDYKNVFATTGLHPVFYSEHCKKDLELLEQKLNNGNSVAIGECGLDGSITPDSMTEQKFYFNAQLELSRQFQLPVIIHARSAVEDVILALKHHKLDIASGNGVIHSYNGSLQQAHKLIDLGYLVSFGGPVTYPRATKLHTLIKQLPLESIMLETDAPDQSAMDHQGQRNEPGFITAVLSSVAALRNQDPQSIATSSNNNARSLFRLGDKVSLQ